MSAYNARNKLARGAKAGRQIVKDPGNGGTIDAKSAALAVCIVTGGTTRLLEDATRYGVGDSILVISQTNTITVNSVALGAGEACEFQVILNSSGAKQWVTSVGNNVNFSTAPAALGTVDINTGDAATDAALIDLANALQAFGLVTHTWT
jgi:hypothetical protein